MKQLRQTITANGDKVKIRCYIDGKRVTIETYRLTKEQSKLDCFQTTAKKGPSIGQTVIRHFCCARPKA